MWIFLLGEPDGKGASFPMPTRDLDGAAVGVHQFADNRQSQAQAVTLFSIEALEDERQVCFGYAPTRIRHVNPAAAPFCCSAEPNGSPGGNGLDGVGYQVDEDLGQGPPVGAKCERPLWDDD